MVRSPLTEQHLKRELAYFREKFPNIHDDELFVVWFLRAFVTEDEEAAARALTGVSNDKQIDAVLAQADDVEGPIRRVEQRERDPHGR